MGHSTTRGVLVGFDGSVSSMRALRWGAEEAALRHLPLTVCHAWHWPYPLRSSDAEAMKVVRGLAQDVVDQGTQIARRIAPHTLVRGHLARGPASAILVEQSGDAQLVLLGAHGQGGFEELAAGPVAVQVAAYGHCPTVIVRDHADPGRPVLVGSDGSPESEAAIGFGFEEAALHGRALLVVHACWKPELVASTELTAPIEEVRATASGRLERVVSLWKEKYPRVETRTSVVMESPHHALRTMADRAGLIVVGSRGTGTIPWLRLGSVSNAILQHASCSVAIVRSGEPEG